MGRTRGRVALGPRVDAIEADLQTYIGNGYAPLLPYLTVNVALWPRTAVLFANGAALSKLSDEQRGWIRLAATEAATYSLTTFGDDQRVLALLCRQGSKLAAASPAQLAGLRKAVAPVYAALRKDKGTAAMLRKIAALKTKAKPRQLAIPRAAALELACPEPDPGPTFPEGIYRFTRTEDDVPRLWPNVNEDLLRLLTGTFTLTFADGRLQVLVSSGGVPGRQAEGTYTTSGQVLTRRWTTFHGCPLLDLAAGRQPLKLRWSSDGDVLRFRLVEPADRIEYVHWESNPFVRIG